MKIPKKIQISLSILLIFLISLAYGTDYEKLKHDIEYRKEIKASSKQVKEIREEIKEQDRLEKIKCEQIEIFQKEQYEIKRKKSARTNHLFDRVEEIRREISSEVGRQIELRELLENYRYIVFTVNELNRKYDLNMTSKELKEYFNKYCFKDDTIKFTITETKAE